MYEALARVGDLRGRKVLDVGCGTGTFAAWLAEHGAAKVWGVDPSQAMLDVARAKVPASVGLTDGTAEQLPFKDGWFERATMLLVVQHVDRPRAFAEVRRVVAADGRLAIATFAPEQFESHWLAPYFPSIPTIDRERFPTPEQLAEELGELAVERLHETLEVPREQALERIRGRHISTFGLIPEDEYAAGLEHAERNLPDVVEVDQHWLVVAARTVRAGG